MIKVGQQRLSADHFEKVLYAGEKIELDAGALGKVEKSFTFLKAYSQNKIIYGINTGLGPMAQYKISDLGFRAVVHPGFSHDPTVIGPVGCTSP